MVTPCLTAKPHPDQCLVTAPSICTGHFEILVVCCFLGWEEWSLNLFCLLAISDKAFLSFLAGVSHRDAGISLGTFPTPWSVSWRTCRIDPSAWPIQDLACPGLHPFASFTASWSGLWGFSTALKYALTCSTFCPVCTGGRSSISLTVSVGVSLVIPSMTLGHSLWKEILRTTHLRSLEKKKKRKLFLIPNLLWIHGGTSSRSFLDALKLRKVRATNLGVVVEDIIHQVEFLSMLWMQTDWLVKGGGPDKVISTAKQTGWLKGRPWQGQ